MMKTVVIEPPTYHIVTHTMQLRMDAAFAYTYDKYAELCRAVYNRAVHEVALGGPERRAYMPYKPKDRKKGGKKTEPPYLDRMSYKLAEKAADAMGVDIAVIRNMARSQLGDLAWHYAFPPNSRDTRNRIGLLLTGWRAEHEWMRACPV